MGPIFCIVAACCLGPSQIVFEPDELQLGELRVGQNPMVRLILRNIGKDPAEPLKLETSCGCLAAGTLPKKIAPDQAAVVDLRLRTLSLPTGPHAWRVRLTYAPSAENLAVQKEVETRLSTVVRRELEVEPAIMALSLGAGGEAETLVKVKDLREKPLRITGFTSTVSGLQVRQAQGEPGEQVMKVTVRGDQIGKSEGLVRLGTNDPEYPVLEVPVSVTVRARQSVRLSPERAELRGAAGTTVSRLVRVEKADGKPTEVAAVKGAEALGLSARFGNGTASSMAATVRLEATLAYGEKLTEVEIKLVDGTVTRLPVFLVGE